MKTKIAILIIVIATAVIAFSVYVSNKPKEEEEVRNTEKEVIDINVEYIPKGKYTNCSIFSNHQVLWYGDKYEYYIKSECGVDITVTYSDGTSGSLYDALKEKYLLPSDLLNIDGIELAQKVEVYVN